MQPNKKIVKPLNKKKMKKVLFAMVAVAALTISSCCNNKAKETTCDKANVECVATDSCCKATCEMADSCQKACAKATCEKADSCQKACTKTVCEKADSCQKACTKGTCEKADACQKACAKATCEKTDACTKAETCEKACKKN